MTGATPNDKIRESGKENRAIQFQQKTPKDVDSDSELEVTRTFEKNEIGDIIKNLNLNKEKDLYAPKSRESPLNEITNKQ